MKKISLLVLSVGLVACAGNPPAWWNPSGAYGVENQKGTSQKTASKTTVSHIKSEETIPAEESIDVSIDEYEELNLTTSGEIKEDSSLLQSNNSSIEDITEQADPIYSSEENLPMDGSLPVPTVLK